jgi:anti-sigma factor RsiW
MTLHWREDSMSHVDEGTLHAYLDGELPSAERAAVEAHVAECATCRASLVEQRALRERASAVLGAARPVERPAPPFEQLRRMPNRSPWHVRTSFAWAASLALAVGLGYYLRNPGSGRLAPAAPAPFGVVAQDRAASAQASAQEEKAAAPVRQRLATRATALARRDETEPSAAAERAPRASDSLVGGAVNTAAAQAAPAPAASQPSAAKPGLDTVRSLDAVTITATPVRAERDRVPAGMSSVAVDGTPVQPLTAKRWPVISRQTARSLLGEEPVGLPGLTTRSFRRSPGFDGTVVVEQALDSSTVIQIFQRPASTFGLPDSAARGYSAQGRERARADRLLARFVGRLRVEIAGPVSPDSLNRLLEQVRPLP